MENFGENSVAWITDGFAKATTNSPETIVEENAVGTLVIIIVSAIVSILFLFVIAVFIDCRHQKLSKDKPNSKKVFKINIPRFSRSRACEDKQSIADRMQSPEATAAPSIVVV
ncbi:hypothetical protein RN001_012044 [Aquatica leii]|uniref:Uncharacterized protein n=1 Tax=Aquatica leii TaxID=1421715 RepID=A0AAN7P3A7_9COLE|nr:hypothetical protein RN001_012044 [Aquatica leii]